MNIDSGSKSTDSTVSKPPAGSPIKVTRYALRHDGVAWLICISAALTDLLVKGDSPRFDGSGDILTILCAFVLTLFWMFIAGAVGSKIGWYVKGQTRRDALIGFSFGAFGIVALTAFNQYQSQQLQSKEISQSVHDLVQNQRSILAGIAFSVPVNSNESATAETKAVVDFVQNFFVDVNKQNKDYQQAITQICGDGVLQPSKLNTPDKIASARNRVAQMRAVQDEFVKNRLALLDDKTMEFARLPFRGAERDSAINEFQRNAKTTVDLVEQLAAVDRDFNGQADQLLDFMQLRLGTFNVVAETPYFNNGADVSKYDAIWTQLGVLAAKEQQITKQSEQLVHHSLDAMDEMCNTQ